VHNMIVTSAGCPSEISLSNLEGFGGTAFPLWNYTVKKIWLNLNPSDQRSEVIWMLQRPFPCLETLKMHSGQLNDEVLRSLLENWPARLEELEIKGMSLNYGSARPLIAACADRLKRLRILNANLLAPWSDLPACMQVVTAKTRFTDLEELTMVNCSLTQADLAAIMTWNAPHLRRLNLSDNFLGTTIDPIPFDSFHLLRQLEELWLCRTGIERAIVRWVLDHAGQTKIRSIFAELEEKDPVFEAEILAHPAYSRFEQIVLWWDQYR
jgi:hypothetical protein